MDFDLAPTDALPGCHFRGTVRQRLITSYPVAPELMARHLPPEATPCLHGGKAWLSACFVQMDHMRPAHMPIGMRFRYLVHRTKAVVPFPDGQRRQAVYVLEAYADPLVPRVLGRALGGAPFRPARIDWEPGRRVTAHAGGQTIYDARFEPGWASTHFASLDGADAFILGMSFGSRHDEGRWRLFPETHAPWTPYGLRATTTKHALLEAWGVAAEADHVIGMDQVPHSFARPIEVPAAT